MNLQRRSFLRWGLGLLAGRIVGSSLDQLQCDAMCNGSSPADERGPVWNHGEWFASAAASAKLVTIQRSALQTSLEDPRVQLNLHELRLGQQQLLRDHGSYLFDQIRQELGFGEWDHWDCHREWLAEVFRTVFPAGEEAIGTFSFLSARRPATFREQQDQTVKVAQGVARPKFMRRAVDLARRPLMVGDLRLPTKGLRFACDTDQARRTSRVAMTVVPRHVVSTKYGFSHHYEEFWYCLADAEQRDLLTAGRVPAVAGTAYRPLAVRIRTSPILNLVRITRTLKYNWLGIEIQPETGEILTLRWGRLPLAAALLNSSPVEHESVQRALQR